jgi:hypothetical protein
LPELEREIFAVLLGNAAQHVEDEQLPRWLADLCAGGLFEDVAKEFGLPKKARDMLVAIVLALDWCEALPAEALDRITGKQLKDHQSEIANVIASINRLEPLMPPDVSVEAVKLGADLGGNISFLTGPGISVRLLDLLEEYSRKLAAIPTSAGRRKTFSYMAHTALMATIDRYQPALNNPQRTELAQQIFFDVRSRHGHKSRDLWGDGDDTPRSRDTIDRIAKAQGSPLRKTRHNPS